MANYRKSFNFRNGVQVDNDNFVVNANGLVGIGTSIPTEFLDVYGTAKITGLTTTTTLYADTAEIRDLTISGGALVSGAMTATTYFGSASGLTDIYAIAVDGWVVDSGNSFISTSFSVGVSTSGGDAYIQVGTGSTIDSYGNATYLGIVTATSFDGDLDATNLSGTISNDRLPSSISVSTVTAPTIIGNLTGIADTAVNISSTSNIIVNSVNSGFSTAGISTVYETLHVVGNAGIGTLEPNAQIHLRKSGISSIQLTSDGTNSSTITFGRDVNETVNNAQIRFGNTNISYPLSTDESLDIINYDTGNLNFYLNPGGSGNGDFNWISPSLSRMMILTSSGNLGINDINPSDKLSVQGNVYISGVATVGNSFTVNDLNVSSDSILGGKLGVSTNSTPSSYDLQVGGNPSTEGVGITSSGNIVASGDITASGFVASSGNITASGDLSITNISANNVSLSGEISGSQLNVSGIITANQINVSTYGDINSSGDLSIGNIYSSGIITASSLDVATFGPISTPDDISNVRNINSSGIITAASADISNYGNIYTTNDINVRDINASGIITASSLSIINYGKISTSDDIENVRNINASGIITTSELIGENGYGIGSTVVGVTTEFGFTNGEKVLRYEVSGSDLTLIVVGVGSVTLALT